MEDVPPQCEKPTTTQEGKDIVKQELTITQKGEEREQGQRMEDLPLRCTKPTTTQGEDIVRQ